MNNISNYHIKVLSSSHERKENLSKRRPWELNLTENKNNEWHEDENRKRSVNTCLSSDKLYKLCYRFIFTLLLSKRLAVHKDSKMGFSPTSVQWYCYKKTTVMAWRARPHANFYQIWFLASKWLSRAREKQFSVGGFERVSRYNRFTFVLMVF